MRRTLNRLSARKVATLSDPGMHADGGGLYLRVRGPTSRSFVFVWHAAGKRREMGLGAPPAVTLAAARERAQEAREVVANGKDPVAQRQVAIPTFGAMADQFIASRSGVVRSDKSIARWKRCIGEGGYADRLRRIRVDVVTTRAGGCEVLACIGKSARSRTRLASCS